MYKKLRFAIPFVLMLAVGIILLTSPTAISAKPIDPPTPGVADGSWEWDNSSVTGVTSPIDLVAAPQPEWRDVMSWDQITLSGAANLCHPFRGGQFGWVGDIRIFTGKAWEPIPTTVEWVPDVEGTLMACAKAPSAGTYALFGGYVKPANQGLPECDFPIQLSFMQFNNTTPSRTGHIPFQLVVAVMDEEHQPKVGTPASYTLSDVYPPESMYGAMKGSTTFQMHPEYPWHTGPVAIFDEIVYIDTWNMQSFILKFVTMGCYVRIDARVAAVMPGL
jgi:hypothetical protein